MVDLEKIKQAEAQPTEYWRGQCMDWWRRYIKNVMIIRRLRSDNRKLRSCLTQVLSK